ncbi:unnamed protein product [Macrosiphum euphorbiae]|uniref:Chitinase n=1 Tax=Macrosiphum euphorbiae TaxID=13131 RepID=A0AAV0XA31_9HEMI|nr:unnamed protein product [Macrosiphum euphorbiae]
MIKDIIRSLVEANKPVYTRIGFESTDDWASIFNPPDAEVFQTKKFDPLVNFLIKFKVNGLIINSADIYNIGVDAVAQKISDFVCEIKKKVDKLIVGLMFSGSFYESFTNITLFDFTITNKVLDLYIIDWSTLNSCDKDAVKTGISPVTSTNPNTITIEKVTCSVTNSNMEKSKIYGMVQIVPIIPLNLLSADATYGITTYSIYCSSTDKANSSQWCTNPSQLSYDQGVHAKKFYAGIVLDQLDTDDYESKCECGPFPVTNIVLDGWSGCPFKACPKLDQN